MQLSKSNISTYHKGLMKEIRRLLEYEITIGPSDSSLKDSWYMVREGKLISFNIFSDGRVMDYESKNSRFKRPIVSMYPKRVEAPPVWLCWYEEWISKGDKRFELLSASWSFYWGAFNRHKTKLFRADWSDPKLQGGTAPQPHWHFDKDLIYENYDYIPEAENELGQLSGNEDLNSVGGGLIELSSGERVGGALDRKIISLSGIHLGMGGWKNHKNKYPECWLCDIDNKKDLIEWSKRILELALKQLERVNIRSV